MKRNLKSIESAQEIQTISLLEGIEMLDKSWRTVTQSTIAHCFRHAGFKKGN